MAFRDDVRAAVALLPRRRGSRQAREVAARADGLAVSPQETRPRLLIAGSPLPRPVAQFEIRARGRFVARVDFAYPDRASPSSTTAPGTGCGTSCPATGGGA